MTNEDILKKDGEDIATVSNDDKLLKSVVDNIGYTITKYLLIKPLPPVMIKKEVAVGTGEKDIDGYEKMKTEIQEVPADHAMGIILQIPPHRTVGDNPITLKVGDTIVYPSRACKTFDLFKDSLLVSEFDVVVLNK